MLGRSRRAVERLRRGPQAARTSARRKRSRATPPNVSGKGPLLAAPGLGVGVVAIIRNEAPYLEEWLAYHHALGVQHFFIYDNGSNDALHEVIEVWVNHGLVTLVHWPLPGGQIDAYSHALRFYGPSVDWLGFFDVDEFLVPLLDDDIPTLLARWPDAADVRIPRKDFGFSGYRTPPDSLTIEAYTEVADVFKRDPRKPPRVKTLLQPRGISAVGIHTATVADTPISAGGRPVPTLTVGKPVHGIAQLNHYYTRSFEEFEAKRFRGSATGRIARPAIPFDLPALETDTSAQRFAPATHAMIEHIRSLDPSPYHYGSELGFSQFPRFNDLGLFAEFAIANTASEEPELRREPGARLHNRFPGIGFVGDISDLPHDPGRGDLSESLHLGPLLERARARVEASWAAAPGSIADSLRRGRASETAAGWTVEADGGEAEVALPLASGGKRRCAALGFVLGVTSPMSLQLALEHEDGSTSQTVEIPFDRAATYAGIVEFEAAPSLAAMATARLLPVGEELVVHDLFVITYG